MIARDFSNEHVAYREDRADHNYEWDVRYTMDFDGTRFLTTVKIKLTGAAPGALLSTWDEGIGNLWNDRGFFSDGTWLYASRYDAKFVASGQDQTVRVIDANGRTDMLNWYTRSDWGPSYNDQIAAHEFGHMFGLFDEYAGGATYSGYTNANGLMADLSVSGYDRYFWTTEYFGEYFSGATLDLVMGKQLNAAANNYSGNAQANAVMGFGGNDNLSGGAGGDWLDGGNGSDKLFGQGDHDQIFGAEGNDILDGGADADRLYGGVGSDRLEGGVGKDQLNGGLGRDSFVFAAAAGSANADKIIDFRSDDIILLSGNIFKSLGEKVSASEFRLGSAPVDRNDFLVYRASTGELMYDADGSGTKYKMSLIADLNNGAPLTWNKVKMFDAIPDLDDLNLSHSGGIEGFEGTYHAVKGVEYSWNFEAYSIPDTLRISDNTGDYVFINNESYYHSGTFTLDPDSNGLITISVSGSEDGTEWVLNVDSVADSPMPVVPMPDLAEFTYAPATDGFWF